MEFINYLKTNMVLNQDKVLFVLILMSIIIVTIQLLSLLIGAAPGRVKINKFNYKPYLPVAIGALAGFSIAGNIVYALLIAVFGGLVGLGGRKVFQWMYNKLTEEKKAGEILILYEIISVYSASGHSLYEALEGGRYLTSLIRKPIERCLSRWSFGPERALEKMGDEINNIEAQALVRILQRTLIVGPGKLAEFLNKESETMERLRQYRIEQGLSARPIMQTLYLLFPGLALVGVTLVPIGYYVQKSISSIKLN